jgi:hypothetical protein
VVASPHGRATAALAGRVARGRPVQGFEPRPVGVSTSEDPDTRNAVGDAGAPQDCLHQERYGSFPLRACAFPGRAAHDSRVHNGPAWRRRTWRVRGGPKWVKCSAPRNDVISEMSSPRRVRTVMGGRPRSSGACAAGPGAGSSSSTCRWPWWSSRSCRASSRRAGWWRRHRAEHRARPGAPRPYGRDRGADPVKPRSRRLLVTTKTDESAIAPPAIIGLSSPAAARGMAATL